MKHLLKKLFVAAFILCSYLSQVFAQQQVSPLPTDPDVRIGKLDNGLTYYLRKNNLPAERADFYIAQKVGSIQEEQNQLGLAHFLEHMCFNGTTHFPGDALKQYLERIGVKFGENLNAYTSVEETVYNISNVPVNTPGAIDSCLLILHDWSNDLTLDPKEIDKERGVINEEWRMSMSASQRLLEKSLPVLFKGTKYATCFPIGTMDVVMNFPHQALRDYYEKWYRPDLQGIVIVGDIDVDAIEAKIKTVFADIPAQPNAAKREYYPIADNKEPIVFIGTDKEQPYIQAVVMCKHDVTPDAQKNNTMYLVELYAKTLIASMLNARLNELAQSANPPYIAAGAYDGAILGVTKTKSAFNGIAICQENNIKGGFTTVLREIERARRFGFTESEYARARAEYLRQLESAYNERDKRRNEQYVNEYVRHFLDNEPIPGIQFEYATFNQLAPAIPVTAINDIMKQLIAEDNRIISLFAPEKEGLALPSADDLKAWMKEVNAETLEPYVDKVSDEPLLKEAPKGGTIMSEIQNAALGTTELTLSNGIKVIIKKTDFKADQILMKGVSLGGSSLFPDSEIINIQGLDAVSVGGLGNFSATDLEKVLAGKKASISYGIGDKTETVNGSCSPKDFETMLQLTYLTFTAPRRDDEAFTSYKNRSKAALQNMELEPMVALQDSVQFGLYGNHPRIQRLKADMVDQMSYDKILSMYNDRFKDAGDFTFIFVGNIDIENMKPLIAIYLGGLPAIGRKETFKDNHMDTRKGEYKNIFIRKQENPKASNFVCYTGEMPYTLKNNILMSMMNQILDIIYTEKVREDEGGAYSIYVGGNLSKYPKEVAGTQIVFDTAPEKREKMMEIIFAEIDNLAKNGPSQENVNKVKEFMLKKHAEMLKENSYWLNSLDELVYSGLNTLEGYEETVKGITPDDIRKFAADLFGQGNEVEVSMISPAAE